MPAVAVEIITPFAVIMGDTYPHPSISLLDDLGEVIDPAGFTVSLARVNAMGEESTMPGTINGMVIEFPWLTDDTIAAAEWQTSAKIDDTAVQYTLSTPRLYVYDTAAMYCSVSDVVAIVGDGYTEYQVLAAIQVAESMVRAWVTTPVGSPVPDRVRMATAILAARVLTSASASGDSGGGGGGIIEERIADYTVRYAEGVSEFSYFGIPIEVQNLLLPWKMRAYTTDIGERRASAEYDEDDDGYLPL